MQTIHVYNCLDEIAFVKCYKQTNILLHVNSVPSALRLACQCLFSGSDGRLINRCHSRAAFRGGQTSSLTGATRSGRVEYSPSSRLSTPSKVCMEASVSNNS